MGLGGVSRRQRGRAIGVSLCGASGGSTLLLRHRARPLAQSAIHDLQKQHWKRGHDQLPHARCSLPCSPPGSLSLAQRLSGRWRPSGCFTYAISAPCPTARPSAARPFAQAIRRRSPPDRARRSCWTAGPTGCGQTGRRGYCFPIRQAANLVVRGAGKATKIVIADPAVGRIPRRPLPSGHAPRSHRGLRSAALLPGHDPGRGRRGRLLRPGGRGRLSHARRRELRQGHGALRQMGHDHRPRHAADQGGHAGPLHDPALGAPRRPRVAVLHRRTSTIGCNLRHMRVGDAYVHLARGYGGVVLAQGCDGMRIENVTGPCLARPGRRPGGQPGRDRRARSGSAICPGEQRACSPPTPTACTASRTAAGPVIERCYFEGMADDAINIYAPPNVLRRGPRADPVARLPQLPGAAGRSAAGARPEDRPPPRRGEGREGRGRRTAFLLDARDSRWRAPWPGADHRDRPTRSTTWMPAGPAFRSAATT